MNKGYLNNKGKITPLVLITTLSVLLLVTLLAARLISVSGRKGISSAADKERSQQIEIEKEPEYSFAVVEDSGTSPDSEQLIGAGDDVSSPDPEADTGDATVYTETEEAADEILRGMALKDKIYQMMILMPEQLTGTENVTAAGPITKENLVKYPVGGIIYMEGNVKDPGQTKSMLTNMQEMALEVEGLPMFLCVDEEGGRVARVGNNPNFTTKEISPMAQIQSADEAYEAGSAIGEYLRDLGFNVTFAPDADVLTNPDNAVIGDRSFGSDPYIVRDYARAYSDGLHRRGILSTYKHFPGHGATAGDTHKGFAYTDKTLEELMGEELVPFADAQEAGADMVMVSHISIPTILGDDTPCSLSKYMITDVLKGDLGYNGIVITDALNMGAITENYSDVTASVEAVKAGNDMLLAPRNFKDVAAKLVSEIEAGNISEDQIDESVRKILIRKLELEH